MGIDPRRRQTQGAAGGWGIEPREQLVHHQPTFKTIGFRTRLNSSSLSGFTR